MKKARIHIAYDGEGPAYTMQIKDIDTGHYLAVRSLSLVLNQRNWNQPLTVSMQVHMPILDLVANAEIQQVCPCCGRPNE